jgi:flagellar motor switch protein FliN/FliY
MSEEDGLDDWAAAMAEQADEEDKTGSESEDPLGMDAEVAQLEEFDEDREITPKEKRKLDTILDIPVTIAMEVGRSNISIRNLLQLNQGSVVELDRVAGEPLDVLVNGTLIAHGEVVVVNDKFGIRLTDVISQLERIKKLR